MQEQLNIVERQKVLKDGLNNLFLRVNNGVLDLRIYGSALKGATYSKDLPKQEAEVFLSELEELIERGRAEVIVSGLEYLPGKSFDLRLARAMGSKIKITVIDSETSEEKMKMKVKPDDLLSPLKNFLMLI